MFLLLSFLLIQLACLQPGITTTLSCSRCADEDGCAKGLCLRRCLNLTSAGAGKNCDCPPQCLNSRCNLNNSKIVCTDGCVPGKRGDNCVVDCPAACTQCGRYDDKCIGPCSRPVFYGNTCEIRCPFYCEGRCDRATGTCNSCKPGHRGKYCNLTCPTNCESGCDKVKWKCNHCTSGYWGSYCNETCAKGCTVCEQNVGKCLMCVDGKKGENCDENCDPSCVSCLQHGDLCTGPCRNELCTSTCIKEKDGKCTVCRDFHFFGKTCEKPCPSNCEGQCDKGTGTCDSCKTGYRGLQCNELCPKHCISCEQIGANCADALYQNIKIVCGFVAAVVLILSAFVIGVLRRHYRKRHQTQEIQQRHGRQESSNTSEPSDRSTYYASKYWEIDDNNLDPDCCSNDAQNGQRDSLPCQSNSLGQGCNSNLLGNLFSNEQFVLENNMYSSGQAFYSSSQSINAAAEASFDSNDHEDCARETRQDLLSDQAGDEEAESSEGSRGHRLSTKSQQTLFPEDSKEFHNLKVKYITPSAAVEN